MSENKRYYWLKLNENFFEDDTIAWLEEQKNGKDYVIFYLKLCLKSLKDDGSLIRYVGQTLIPYDVPALAKLTGTNEDTVAVAMRTFVEIGLVGVKNTGEIYLSQINELIGSETDSAKRMRKKRAKENEKNKLPPSHCDRDVQKSDTELEIEIDKELEIEIDKNIIDDDDDIFQRNLTLNDFALNNNFHLTTIQIRELVNIRENYFDDNDDLIRLALLKSAENGVFKYNYVKGILGNWFNHEIKTIEEVEELDRKHKAAKTQSYRPKQSKQETVPETMKKEAKETELSEEQEEALRKKLEETRERLAQKK